MGVIQRKAFQASQNPKIPKSVVQGNRTVDGKTLQERIILRIPEYFKDIDSVVYLNGNDFIRIFGARRGSSDKYRGEVPVVNITRKETGQSIHRVFKTCSDISEINNYVGLSYESLLNLSKTNEDFRNITELELSEGNVLLYYWYHPHHATKISTRLGMGSLLLAFIPFLIQLFEIIFKFII